MFGVRFNWYIGVLALVNLGFFAMPLHPKERVYREVMEENREAVILADQLGFTEAWIGEHQTSISEPISDPFLFLFYPFDSLQKR